MSSGAPANIKLTRPRSLQGGPIGKRSEKRASARSRCEPRELISKTDERVVKSSRAFREYLYPSYRALVRLHTQSFPLSILSKLTPVGIIRYCSRRYLFIRSRLPSLLRSLINRISYTLYLRTCTIYIFLTRLLYYTGGLTIVIDV